MQNNDKNTVQVTGCCLLSLLYLPFGIILELTKKYNKPRRGRRR